MEDSSDNTNHLDIIDLDNNIEYKGQFGGDDNEDELQFYEHGAHFKYKALYNKLEQIVNALHDNDLISCNSPCRNTSSHKQSKMNHKYVSNFMIQSRNINNNNYHTNRQGNAVNGNGNNNQKCSEKNVMSVVNDKGMKGKSNHTFGNKTNNIGVGVVNNNNNNNHKKAPALSGNKNKNVVAKNAVKKTAKVDIKGNKNKVQSTTGNNVNSQSSSKPKNNNNNNNNIKSISNKKPISTISNNNNNQKIISATKHQTKLSSSYQNLCLNKIISPSKKPITQGIISNIKYKKVNTNPSLNKKQTSPPKNTTTTVTTNNNQLDIKKNTINLKSRNGYNDILTQNTKNNKANNNANILQPTNNKKPKKDEDKQSLTYQQSNNNNNNDEQSKPVINGLITKNNNNNNTNNKTTTTNTNINKASTHSKVRNEIIGIVIKQKPHSQDRPNNIFLSNVIKNVTNNITKKGTNTSNTRQNVSKPQSANIAYTIITSVKKGNSLTNRKASPPSAKQLNSYNRTTQRPQTHQPKPKPFLKKAVINNITTIHIPLSEGLSSSGSKNKKISSRNSRNTQVAKTAININTCINNNNHTRPVSNNVKHKLSIGKHGMKSIGKGSLNIKVIQLKAGSNSNSNKKGSSSLQGVSKTQENKNMKILNRGSSNVKEKQTHTHILITEHKVDMSEYNSCPIDIIKDKDKDELIL